MCVGYIPYAPAAVSVEAGWLAAGLRSRVEIGAFRHSLNLRNHENLPDASRLRSDFEPLCAHPWVVAEGIGGFLWAAVARANGFSGAFTVLPYLNPTSWFDLTAIAVYRRYADRRDRVFVGSTPSARIYRALGINATVGEPFGIDCDVFRPRDGARAVRPQLGIGLTGSLLLFAGRVEPDKDLHRLLSVASGSALRIACRRSPNAGLARCSTLELASVFSGTCYASISMYGKDEFSVENGAFASMA